MLSDKISPAASHMEETMLMRTAYPPLSSSLLPPATGFSCPAQGLPERVGLEDPAIKVMTDLSRVCAVVIGPTDSIEEAHKRMIQRGVRLLLVLDLDRKVIGLITATDIQGEKPMKVIAHRGCRREDIVVTDIMTPRARLEALEFDDVRRAKVGHIVATLTASGRQHAMTVERDTQGRATLRGLFSSTQIARQLGVVIHTTEVARTFSEIESLLGS